VLPPDAATKPVADILQRKCLDRGLILAPRPSVCGTTVVDIIAGGHRRSGISKKVTACVFEDSDAVLIGVFPQTNRAAVILPRFSIRFDERHVERLGGSVLEFAGKPGYVLIGGATTLPKVLPATIAGKRATSANLSIALPLATVPVLVLRRVLTQATDGVSPIKPRYIVLMPANSLPEDDYAVSRTYFEYELHDHFSELRPSKGHRARLAALHLALVFAFAPDAKPFATGLNGRATAIRILRRCRSNHPLSKEESEKLDELAEHAPPTVFLAALGVWQSAGGDHVPRHLTDRNRIAVATAAIRRAAARGCLPDRERPTADEWARAVGPVRLPRSSLSFVSHIVTAPARLDERTTARLHRQIARVEDLEWKLRWNGPREVPSTGSVQPFVEEIRHGVLRAFGAAAADNGVMRETLDDFSESTQHARDLELRYPGESMTDMCEELIDACNTASNMLLHAIQHCEQCVPLTWHEAIIARSHLPVSLRKADFVVFASWKLGSTPEYSTPRWTSRHPSLAAVARDLASKHLTMLVLRDMAVRVRKLAENPHNNVSALYRELAPRSPAMYRDRPYWRGLEAELRIAIRPQQYETWAQLQKASGTALQLNMGEGKTQVIIPMIILSTRFGKTATSNTNNCNRSIARVTLLPALLGEAQVNLTHTLSFSGFAMHQIALPFSRDTPISYGGVRRGAATRSALSTNGFILMSREHRLSLLQKTRELHYEAYHEDKRADKPELSRVFESDHEMFGVKRIVDIFDEVDELMSPKSRLIYSVGPKSVLPSLATRCAVIPFVLRCVLKCSRLAVEDLKIAAPPDHDVSLFESAFGEGKHNCVLRFVEPREVPDHASKLEEWYRAVFEQLATLPGNPPELEFLRSRESIPWRDMMPDLFEISRAFRTSARLAKLRRKKLRR
jgi:hypothetical protein